jgi:hypothetical protein
MILLGYIISGHTDWKDSEIKIFACFTDDNSSAETKKLFNLIASGQLPISTKNIKVMSLSEGIGQKELIQRESQYADLSIIGLQYDHIKHSGSAYFAEFAELGNTIFVNSLEEKYIK